MSGRREWFSLAELAALKLPNVPGTKQGIQALAERENWQRLDWKDRFWRARVGRGGGVEFHSYVLPRAAQVKLAIEPVSDGRADPRAVSM